MRLQRLLGLLYVLADVDKITVQELARRFQVSKRTIFRDLDALNCAGFPIVSYPGAGGGVSVVEGYRIHKRILSVHDVRKLFMALKGLESIDGDPSISILTEKLVPEQEKAFTHSDYVINLSPWFGDSVSYKKAMALHDAVCENRCVLMEYVSRTGRKKRIVEPHKLIFKQSDWYLYAFCRERHQFRLFKLRRIISHRILEEKFAPRETEDIKLEDNYGAGLFSQRPEDGFFQVVLEYDRKDEFALTQKIDGTFFQEISGECDRRRICFYTSSLSLAGDLVFQMLDKVSVVSPPELFDYVKSRLEAVYQIYDITTKGDT